MSELLRHCLQSPSRAPPTVLLPNPQTASRPCHCRATTTGKHVEKVYFNRRNQISQPVTLHSQRMDDLTGLLLWGGSRLTCIVKTNSPCLSSHDEDVNIFWLQQASIFTATLLFQPQLITTLYIQLQIIINRQFAVLHTCAWTLFHTWHSREMQEILRRTHNNKRLYFI